MLHRLMIPGRALWAVLIALLALAALMNIGLEQDALVHPWGGSWLGHSGSLLGVLVTLLAVAASLVIGLRVRSDVDPLIDHVFLAALSSWLLSTMGHGWAGLVPHSVWGNWAMLASYQLTVHTTVLFLLACAPFDAVGWRRFAWCQLLASQLLLAWASAGGIHQDLALSLWRGLNVVCSTALMLMFLHRLLTAPRAWLVLGACLIAWGVALGDMVLDRADELRLTPMHHMLAAYLLMLWLLLTHRIRAAAPQPNPSPASSHNSLRGGAFAPTDLGREADTQRDPTNGRALLQTRQRIAQDLHDGVGSQIVSMIATLDTEVPQQREMVSALEECLLSVKILVDDIEETHESVLEAMGRLRYRVQHSLERLGIALIWEVDSEGPLHLITGDRSRQVLRVAQEAVANVMRHSRASRVLVRCFFVSAGTQLVLEVHDNGAGFVVADQTGAGGGKGLAGIHRRAQAIDATLTILSQPGRGTLVRLRVPL